MTTRACVRACMRAHRPVAVHMHINMHARRHYASFTTRARAHAREDQLHMCNITLKVRESKFLKQEHEDMEQYVKQLETDMREKSEDNAVLAREMALAQSEMQRCVCVCARACVCMLH